MPDVPALTAWMLLAKASVLLAVALALAALVRGSAAARRHAVWAGAFVAVLALPLGTVLVPSWYAGWMPTPPASASATVAAPTVTPGERPAALPGLPSLTAPAAGNVRAALRPADLARGAYGVGALGVLVYGLLGALRLRRWRAASLPDRALMAEAAALAGPLGIRRHVAVRVAPGLPTPMTWGVRRPLVLLPATAAQWPEERRRVVFLHELAHVARFDALTQTLAFAGCALLWFHPLAWWGAHAMRVERERACDDLVLASGTRASAYAAHLVALARTLRPRAVPAFAAAVVRQSELESRIHAILAPRARRGRVGRRGALAASALVAGVVLPLAAFQPWARPRPLRPPASPAPDASSGPSGAPAPLQEQAPLHARYAVRPGGTLALSADLGSIEVVTTGGDAVDVTVHRTLGLRLDGGASNGDVTLALRRTEPQRAGRTSERVRTVVRVPRRYSVRLSTAGGAVSVARLDGSVDAQTAGGAITLEGASGDVRGATSGGPLSVGRVDGRLSLRTSGGPITLDGGAGGALVAETSGGAVRATLDRAPTADVDLRTAGGAIDLTLPAHTNAVLDAATTAGRVASDFGTPRGAALRTTLGRGGPLVRLRTAAGPITIHRSRTAAASMPEAPETPQSGEARTTAPASERVASTRPGRPAPSAPEASEAAVHAPQPSPDLVTEAVPVPPTASAPEAPALPSVLVIKKVPGAGSAPEHVASPPVVRVVRIVLPSGGRPGTPGTRPGTPAGPADAVVEIGTAPPRARDGLALTDDSTHAPTHGTAAPRVPILTEGEQQ